MAEGRLLLVEDEPGLQLTLSDRLIAEGYLVETAGDGELGLDRATAEAFDLIDWCGREGHDLTFIEVMPMGDIGGEQRLDQYLPISLLRAKLKTRYTLEDIDYRTGGPARYARIAETGQRVGFITPLTHNFCESCNRVRLTCTGMLYMCLGQEDAADLRTPLRASESNDLLNAAIDAAILRKPKGHDFIIDRRARKPAVSRHMSVTGG